MAQPGDGRLGIQDKGCAVQRGRSDLTTVGEEGGAPAVPNASPDASADAPLRDEAEEKSQVKVETPSEKRGWRTLGFWRARWEWFAALVLRHKVFSVVLAGGA